MILPTSYCVPLLLKEPSLRILREDIAKARKEQKKIGMKERRREEGGELTVGRRSSRCLYTAQICEYVGAALQGVNRTYNIGVTNPSQRYISFFENGSTEVYVVTHSRKTQMQTLHLPATTKEKREGSPYMRSSKDTSSMGKQI